MAEESDPGATMIIRAWRTPDGKIQARISHGVDGQTPALEIATVDSEFALIALVKEWMDRIGS